MHFVALAILYIEMFYYNVDVFIFWVRYAETTTIV